MKLGGALITEPNLNMRGVSPKEWADFSSNLHRLVDTQTLQSLNIEYSVIKFALGTFVSVNTLPLTKDLFIHMDSPFPRAASRETLNRQ
jgi:hypothetical protein